MASSAFLDTNVLVYLFDRGEPEKQAVARRIVGEGAEEGSLVVSTQVLQEFYAVVTRSGRARLGPEAAERAVLRLCEFPVVTTDPALVMASIRRSRAATIDFWDALIVEAALSAGCTRLLSEDLQHGREFDGLRVENPFRP